MIINFSVQNFGSIKDKQTLSFEADKSTHLEDYYIIHTNGLRLLKLGLIYGANASGKTTILKALDFLRTLVLNPKSQKTETFDFDPFLFDENTPNQNTIFEIEFLQNNVRYFYFVELNTKAIVSEELYAYNPKKSNVFKRTTDLEKQTTDIKFGNKIKIDKISEQTLVLNTLWNRVVLDGFNRTNVDIKELNEVLVWFKDYLNPLIKSNTDLKKLTSSYIKKSTIQKNIILNILKQADFNVSDIQFREEIIDIPNGFMDFIENPTSTSANKEYKLKSDTQLSTENLEFQHTVNNHIFSLVFEKESQGTQRYYGLAGVLYRLIKDSVAFSIDELESSLHPDLFEHFLLSFLLNSTASQILATTHNREIISEKDIFRKDAIWITDKDNKNCATELYSLADFHASVIRNTSSIYNAFKIGKLGGTPNLGSYYINVETDEA
jgi:AAA15 family ATPase/GTPase